MPDVNTDENPIVIEVDDPSTTIEINVSNTRGERGKSAYDVAVDEGFVGTEQEWLDSTTFDDSIENDTLLVLDPSNMDAAIEQAAEMWSTATGQVLPQETLDATKAIFAAHIVDEPVNLHAAVNNIAILLSVITGNLMGVGTSMGLIGAGLTDLSDSVSTLSSDVDYLNENALFDFKRPQLIFSRLHFGNDVTEDIDPVTGRLNFPELGTISGEYGTRPSFEIDELAYGGGTILIMDQPSHTEDGPWDVEWDETLESPSDTPGNPTGWWKGVRPTLLNGWVTGEMVLEGMTFWVGSGTKYNNTHWTPQWSGTIGPANDGSSIKPVYVTIKHLLANGDLSTPTDGKVLTVDSSSPRGFSFQEPAYGVAVYDFETESWPDRPLATVVTWIGPSEPLGWEELDVWRVREAPATVPGAPTSVVAAGGDAVAVLTWVAPVDDGGSAILGYVITPYEDGVEGVAFPVGDVLTYEVDSLVNGTPYTFTVAAVNAVGTGPDSIESNEVTPEAPSVPTVVQTSPVAEGGSGTTSVTATLGATPTVGNVLVACTYSWTSSANTPVPAGWTQVAERTVSGITVRILSRVVQSGDGTGWTFTTSVGIHQGVVVYEITPSTVNSSATATAATSTSMTIGPTADPVPFVLPIAITSLTGQNELWTFPVGWTATNGTRFTTAIGTATDAAVSVTVTKAVARTGYGVLATFEGA